MKPLPNRSYGNVPASSWILLIAVGLRLVFLVVSVNNGGDAVDRFAKTEQWLSEGGLKLFFGGWMPLHFWLMGGLSFVTGNVEWAGRLLSLALGCASLYLFWGTAREVYGPAAARLSLIVFSLYGIHIAYSTTSSSEVPYLFFVILGLYCFIRGRASNQLWWMAAAGLALTLGAAIRYEAWIAMAALALILIGPPSELLMFRHWVDQRLRAFLVFCFTAGLWPAFWMSYNYVHLGHPLYYVAKQQDWVRDIVAFGQTSWLYRLLVSPGTLLLTLTPVVVGAALWSVWLAWKQRKGRELAFVWLFFAAIQFYQTVSGGMWSSARFTITQGALLAALSGYGLLDLTRKWPLLEKPLPLLVGVLMSVNLAGILLVSESRLPMSDQFSSVSPRLKYRNHIQEVGDFLRPRLQPDDALVVDDYNLESTLVLRASGLPHEPGARAFKGTVNPPETVMAYLVRMKPKYVVYADRGKLKPYLPLPQDCNSIGRVQGMEFRCVFQNKVYRVYEASYPAIDSARVSGERTLP